MDFNSGQLLTEGEYHRAAICQALLIERGFKVLQVMYPGNGVLIVDILVDPDGPVKDLKGTVYARINGQDIWQAPFLGVRVRWITPAAPRVEQPPAVIPQPVFTPMATRRVTWRSRFMTWLLGPAHAH